MTCIYDEATGGFGIGRLTSLTDAAGTLSRVYDERGNLLSEMRLNSGVTLVTKYTYDAASRVVSITYPSGWTAAYTRDAMGRTTGLAAQSPDGSTSLPVLNKVAYQPSARSTRWRSATASPKPAASISTTGWPTWQTMATARYRI